MENPRAPDYGATPVRRIADSLTPAAQALAPSAAITMAERCDARAASGLDVTRLALGQSPFPVPDVMVAALRAAAAERDYLPVRGLPALRRTIAEYVERRFQIDRTQDDVLIGPGSKELLFLLQTVFDGDLVVPTPAWVPYAPQARVLGRAVIPVEARAETGWMPTPSEIDAALGRGADERPRILVLNSPHNPTGLQYRAEDLQQIAIIARRHGALVLSDEIYAELHHKGQHASIARWYSEGTILSTGLSKWTGAGGWRLGAFVFPEELRGIEEAMARVASETYTSTSAPVQHAAIVAFAGDPEVERYLVNVRRVLSLVGRHTARRLGALGLVCPQPTGAFYVFADFGPKAAALARAGIATSAALCERLLDDTGVALLPGSAFGRPAAELTVRVADGAFDGQKARAGVAVLPREQPLDDSFLLRHAPRVLDGLDRIGRWLKKLEG